MGLRHTARALAAELLPLQATRWLRRAFHRVTYRGDLSPADIALHRRVAPFTMTSPERVVALRDAVEHVCDRALPGDVVECGVWRGGSMMVVAEVLRRRGERRTLHLFDTFEGMPPPTEHDVDWRGRSARAELDNVAPTVRRSAWAVASEAEVRRNLASTGYDPACVRFVVGRVEDTLPAAAPDAIALLRLDTDWYESTRHELEHLYPRVVSGGVIIIDDYGDWQGARRAVDDYLSQLEVRPLLTRLDETGRLLIKP